MPDSMDNPILNSPYDPPARYFEVGPSGRTGQINQGRRPTESFSNERQLAVELQFDAVVRSLLPFAADVLLDPMSAFNKQVLHFCAPVAVFGSPHVNRRGAALQQTVHTVGQLVAVLRRCDDVVCCVGSVVVVAMMPRAS